MKKLLRESARKRSVSPYSTLASTSVNQLTAPQTARSSNSFDFISALWQSRNTNQPIVETNVQ